MLASLGLWAQIEVPKVPESAKGLLSNPLVLGVVGLILLGVLLLAYQMLFRKRSDPDAHLRERVADFPPPPALGSHQLVFDGVPVRVRLVVVAPIGRSELANDDVPGLLDAVCKGLAAVVKADKPRVRVWPPQLSKDGFTWTFKRVIVPDTEGTSEWLRPAGPVKAGARPILLGLALWADEANDKGHVVVKEANWAGLLRVERT
jgi:hypothetical protein